MKGIRGVLIYTAVVFAISAVYFIYAYSVYPTVPERETFLSEIGEELGNIGLFGLLLIYGRSVLKLVLGKGRIAQRLLPDYSSKLQISLFNRLLSLLNHSHIYVGIATVAIILLHIGLMGIPMRILFFPAVLLLVIWQAVFGLFLSWRYSPRELKNFSYLVHAQFLTGIMIGIFAWFGHLLIDD